MILNLLLFLTKSYILKDKTKVKINLSFQIIFVLNKIDITKFEIHKAPILVIFISNNSLLIYLKLNKNHGSFTLVKAF